MSGVVEAAQWALALVVLFSVFIDLVWVLTGTLESLCEPPLRVLPARRQ